MALIVRPLQSVWEITLESTFYGTAVHMPTMSSEELMELHI